MSKTIRSVTVGSAAADGTGERGTERPGAAPQTLGSLGKKAGLRIGTAVNATALPCARP